MLTLFPVEPAREEIPTKTIRFAPGTIVVLLPQPDVKAAMKAYWCDDLQNFCDAKRIGRVTRCEGAYACVSFKISTPTFLEERKAEKVAVPQLAAAATLDRLPALDAFLPPELDRRNKGVATAGTDLSGPGGGGPGGGGGLHAAATDAAGAGSVTSEFIAVSHSFPVTVITSLVEHRAREFKVEIVKLMSSQRYREVISLVDVLLKSNRAVTSQQQQQRNAPGHGVGVAPSSELGGMMDFPLDDETQLIEDRIHRQQAAELYSARSTAWLGLQKYVQAVADAQLGINMNAECVMAHVALIEAHHAFGKLDRASAAIEEAHRVCHGGTLETDAFFSSVLIYDNVLRTFESRLRRAKCNLDVSLGPESKVRPARLALHVTRDFRQGDVLVREAPALICPAPTATRPQCAQCGYLLVAKQEMVRAVLSSSLPRDAAVILGDKCRRVLGNRDDKPCIHECGERYCSDTCRAAAWSDYHQLCCPKRGRSAGVFETIDAEFEAEGLTGRHAVFTPLFRRGIAMLLLELEHSAGCEMASVSFHQDQEALWRQALKRLGEKIGMPTKGKYLPSADCVPAAVQAAVRALSASLPRHLLAIGFDIAHDAVCRLFLHCARYHITVAKSPLYAVVGGRQGTPQHLTEAWAKLSEPFTTRSVGLFPIVGTASSDLAMAAMTLRSAGGGGKGPLGKGMLSITSDGDAGDMSINSDEFLFGVDAAAQPTPTANSSNNNDNAGKMFGGGLSDFPDMQWFGAGGGPAAAAATASAEVGSAGAAGVATAAVTPAAVVGKGKGKALSWRVKSEGNVVLDCDVDPDGGIVALRCVAPRITPGELVRLAVS